MTAASLKNDDLPIANVEMVTQTGEYAHEAVVLSTENSTDAYIAALGNDLNIPRLRDFLTSVAWPEGLQTLMFRNLNKLALRFFICDDSASMSSQDGKRLHGTGPSSKYTSIECQLVFIRVLFIGIVYSQADNLFSME